MSIPNIRVGDQVRFMNEVGGGTVTAILSKDMVSVETQDGFEIPTYLKNNTDTIQYPSDGMTFFIYLFEDTQGLLKIFKSSLILLEKNIVLS